MTRVIRENRNEEADLAARNALVEAEQARLGVRKVIPPAYPRESPAGSPESESGTKVSFDELDANLQALIGGAAGGVAALPHREWDVTAGPAIPAGDPFNIGTGTFVGAGARTTLYSSSTPMPGLPATGAAFVADSRIDIWLAGQHLSFGPNAGTPRDVYWVSASEIAFATNLKGGDTIRLRGPANF